MNMKNLDFKTAGFWPENTKKIAFAAAFSVVLVVGWFALLSGQRSQLKTLEAKESQLRTDYETAQTKANNLNSLKQELAQINDLLKTLIARLPNQNEIPELIVNVSQAALANGLQVDLFEPQNETKQEFYAEKRINVNLKGDYHQLGAFFSEVAMQPRLVAVVIDDMKMSVVPPEKKKADNKNADVTLAPTTKPIMNFEGSVRTYRYLSAEEEAEVAEAKKAKEKKGKGKGKPKPKGKEESPV